MDSSVTTSPHGGDIVWWQDPSQAYLTVRSTWYAQQQEHITTLIASCTPLIVDIAHICATYVRDETDPRHFDLTRTPPGVSLSMCGCYVRTTSHKDASILGAISYDHDAKQDGTFTITCDHVTAQGCRYIGLVVDAQYVDLDSNLQRGASQHRIAWDGSCARLYVDIPTPSKSYNYEQLHMPDPQLIQPSQEQLELAHWRTGDVIMVKVLCSQDRIEFYKNSILVRVVSLIPYVGLHHVFTPVIGMNQEHGATYHITYVEAQNTPSPSPTLTCA